MSITQLFFNAVLQRTGQRRFSFQDRAGNGGARQRGVTVFGKSVATVTVDKMIVAFEDGRAFIDGAVWIGKGNAASDLTSHWSALKIDMQSCK